MRFEAKALVAVLVMGAASPVLAASEFTFAIPPGWTDLSPGSPGLNTPGLPQALLEQARAPGLAAMAMELGGPADGFAENFNVRVMPSVFFVSYGSVKNYVEGLAAEMEKEGVPWVVADRTTATIGGVQAGRIVADINIGGHRMRQLVYILPGAQSTAILTYTSTPEAFSQYLPVFERAAMASQGLAQPSRVRWLFASDDGHYRLGLIAGALFGVIIVLVGVRYVTR